MMGKTTDYGDCVLNDTQDNINRNHEIRIELLEKRMEYLFHKLSNILKDNISES